MTNNEPLFALIKAHKMKIYRSVEAKKVHEDMIKYHNAIIEHNKKKIGQYDIMIRSNKLINSELFGKFWSVIQCS